MFTFLSELWESGGHGNPLTKHQINIFTFLLLFFSLTLNVFYFCLKEGIKSFLANFIDISLNEYDKEKFDVGQLWGN